MFSESLETSQFKNIEIGSFKISNPVSVGVKRASAIAFFKNSKKRQKDSYSTLIISKLFFSMKKNFGHIYLLCRSSYFTVILVIDKTLRFNMVVGLWDLLQMSKQIENVENFSSYRFRIRLVITDLNSVKFKIF